MGDIPCCCLNPDHRFFFSLSRGQVESQPEVKDFMTIDWTYYAVRTALSPASHGALALDLVVGYISASTPSPVLIEWGTQEKDREWGKRSNKKSRQTSTLYRFFLNLYDSLQSWLALGLTGFLCGLIASMVSMGSDWMNDIKFGVCSGRGFWITRQMCCKDSADMLQCENWRSWADIVGAKDPATLQLLSYLIYVTIAVVQAGYAAWLCKTFAPYASGSGIGEIKVILSGFVIKKFLGGWTLVIKSVGLVLTVGSGLCIGKEGPFIHVCCCIGNVVCRFFSKYRTNEGKKRELLSSAAAAGVAVAFGAPIGGVLFSLEEVSSYFPPRTMWRSLFCAVVAAMTLQRWNPLSSGKLVMFEVTYHHQWKLFELIPFMLIGAIGGLVGALINKYNVKFSKFRKTSQLKKWPVTEVMVTSLCTSLVTYTVVYLRGRSVCLSRSPVCSFTSFTCVSRSPVCLITPADHLCRLPAC